MRSSSPWMTSASASGEYLVWGGDLRKVREKGGNCSGGGGGE